MSGECWEVKTEFSKRQFFDHVEKLLASGESMMIQVHAGKSRSLSQNSLFHLWMRQHAAHLLKKSEKEVTEAEVEGIKRTAKRAFYLETGSKWMIHEIPNFETGESKKDFRSTTKLKSGEMYHFMTFCQQKAAEDGCILESMGEFSMLQDKQVA